MSDAVTKPTAQGWAFPGRANKAHYFVQTMSLCGKWGFYAGPLDDEGADKPSKDDCAACRREYQKRNPR